MMPRTKIGRSRVEVDARECADMIFGGCPKVLRADKGTAPQVGYSAAAHKAAAKSTTDVASANSTPMTTAKAAAHVTATEATSDMASAEATSHVAAAEATSHVAAAKATPDMAAAKATSHVAAAKSATASGVASLDKYQLITLTVRSAACSISLTFSYCRVRLDALAKLRAKIASCADVVPRSSQVRQINRQNKKTCAAQGRSYLPIWLEREIPRRQHPGHSLKGRIFPIP
jgi:hypothetical protein